MRTSFDLDQHVDKEEKQRHNFIIKGTYRTRPPAWRMTLPFERSNYVPSLTLWEKEKNHAWKTTEISSKNKKDALRKIMLQILMICFLREKITVGVYFSAKR